MRCTEVADRPFSDGKFFVRDIGDRGRSSKEQAPKIPMTRRSRILIVASICGSLLGAALISYAYKTQGGIGLSFAIVGAMIGGIAGYFTITQQLRMQILGAAIGSIAALTLFQVPVCDGLHYGMPVIGGLIGLIFGGLFESFLKSKTARVVPITDADTVESTNKAMHTKPSIGRF